MVRAIILNGPPFVGKDHGAQYIEETYGAHHQEMKYKLIELTRAIHCVSKEQWDAMYVRTEKEKPQTLLDGRTPREALIHVSETVIKPNYGRDYFGKATAKMLLPGLNAVSDGGFIEEAEEFAKVIGGENILVLRLFSKGYDWGRDSRGYYDPERMEAIGVRYVDVVNDRGPGFTAAIESACATFLNGRQKEHLAS